PQRLQLRIIGKILYQKSGRIILSGLHEPANELLHAFPVRDRGQTIFTGEHDPLRLWEKRFHSVPPNCIAIEGFVSFLDKLVRGNEDVDASLLVKPIYQLLLVRVLLEEISPSEVVEARR